MPATYKRTAPGSIWLHAVSVGEVITSFGLVNELRAANPHIPIYLSTTTLAGRTLADQKLAASLNGLFYAPIDYTFAVRRVLRSIRPAVVVVLETEIWPNLYRQIKRAECGLLVINGRISDRALPRYRRFRPVFHAALAYPDAIFTQSESDRERYVEIGAPHERVKIGGNLKYDARAGNPPAPPQAIADLIASTKPEAVWIAASTMPGADSSDPDESELVLSTFEQLAPRYPRMLLIIAPRKPERFDLVADALRARGINFVRRTQLGDLVLPGVLLLDTIGELASTFALSDVVFMGGTIARRGGHNILEPAFAARPIIIGPHMENFTAIADEFRTAGAVVEIGSPAELTAAVDALLKDSNRRTELGRLAVELANRRRGGTARAVREILSAHDRAVPAWNLYGFGKTLAGCLTPLWKWGGKLKQPHAPQSLATPVISVGGISMGGAGKTPFVLLLAEGLRKLGIKPAILTRGYGRRSLAKMIIIPAHGSAPVSSTGDEAQIFVRSGTAHVGICADRYLAGRAIEDQLKPDVFLLDDGFQHRRLKRDLDIVLIDALDPFAGGALFPRGRLREPLDALVRADVFVITRAQPGREYEGIRERLRQFNPNAPMFLATVELKHMVHPSNRFAAFCGLGNPDSFWTTLHEANIEPVFTWAFRDHHVYKPNELRRLAAQARSRGAKALITTEKDFMNLPENFAALIAPVELCRLDVELKVQNEHELFALIRRALVTALPRSSQPVSEQQV